jgi:predicted MPP superfamily phosphohydrolase
MSEEIIKLAANQGLWAVLAVVLLFYVLKQNEKRETGYQNTISKNQTIIESLSDTIKTKITCMEDDIKEIKEKF